MSGPCLSIPTSRKLEAITWRFWRGGRVLGSKTAGLLGYRPPRPHGRRPARFLLNPPPQALSSPNMTSFNRVSSIPSISGLVVKSIVAIDGPRVRFAANAENSVQLSFLPWFCISLFFFLLLFPCLDGLAHGDNVSSVHECHGWVPAQRVEGRLSGLFSAGGRRGGACGSSCHVWALWTAVAGGDALRDAARKAQRDLKVLFPLR